MTKGYVKSVTELIGQSPVVKLKRMVPEGAADVFVKLEFFNPGGSVKDRIALSMIQQAEADGRLKPGQTIIEPTDVYKRQGYRGSPKGYSLVNKQKRKPLNGVTSFFY